VNILNKRKKAKNENPTVHEATIRGG